MMKNTPVNAVLPVGAADVLPPYADLENDVQNTVMNLFSAFGYQRIAPSFLEFEDTLLSEADAKLNVQTMRFPDSVSGKMMGVRADMTVQAARIAVTRLKNEPRPLRLAYTGVVLRSACDDGFRRQVLQTGAELTGADCPAADAEIILLAHEALKTVLKRPVCVDLTLPTLFKALCRAYGVQSEDAKEIQEFLNQKDFQAVSDRLNSSGRKVREKIGVFEKLFEACGEAPKVISLLDGIDLPDEARAECRRLCAVADILKREAPDLYVTADVLENRGFEYHSGLSFAFFDKESGVELARGGRYLAGGSLGACEAATGVTLLTDAVLSLLTPKPACEKIYLPAGTPFAKAAELIKSGKRVVFGLSADAKTEAAELNCASMCANGKIQNL